MPLSASQPGMYSAEHVVTILYFGGFFAFTHVLTFSHVAFKLQHWFQLSLVCKQINSANTFQILSQCKTNIALEKSNYRTDSSSTKQPQRFLLISPLSLISQNSLSSYFYQDKKKPGSSWTLKFPSDLAIGSCSCTGV